jgi:Transposase DDE domain
MKARCCPNTPMRKIARSVHESARNVARDIARTVAHQQSRKDRKKVEMLLAHLKRILQLGRLRLRRLSGLETNSCSQRARRTCDEWRNGCCRQQKVGEYQPLELRERG